MTAAKGDVSRPVLLFFGFHEVGRVEKERFFLTLGSQLLCLQHPNLFPLPPLLDLPRRRLGSRALLTGLPISVQESNSSPAWSHVIPA